MIPMKCWQTNKILLNFHELIKYIINARYILLYKTFLYLQSVLYFILNSIKNAFSTKDKKKEEEKSSTDDGFQRFSWKVLRSKKALCAIQGKFKEARAEKNKRE